ncbi:hypothetical protein HY346_02315 [Candidatus Microgenomates bacterium]|nr:hypothetical protein [Candidatus Microgenomates bacterium]
MAEDAVAETKMELERPQRKGKRLVLYIVVVIVAFVIMLFVFVNTATSEAVKVSNKFLDNIQAGAAPAAYELFSTEAKAQVTANDFTGLVGQIGPILNTQEKTTGKEIAGEAGQAATAKVTYEITGTDGRNYELVVNLIKANEVWRVLNFDSHLK